MIDVVGMKQGTEFYYCCDEHWIVKCIFVKLLERDRRIRIQYPDGLGVIYEIGATDQLSVRDLKYCFYDKKSAKAYQTNCGNKILNMSKNDLLLDLLSKCEAAGVFSQNQGRLYSKAVRRGIAAKKKPSITYYITHKTESIVEIRTENAESAVMIHPNDVLSEMKHIKEVCQAEHYTVNFVIIE